MKRVLFAFAVVACCPGSLAAQQGGTDALAKSSAQQISLEAKETSLGAAHHGIHWWSLTVSPDGKRVAYTVHKAASKGWLALAPLMVGRNDAAKAVVDGVEGPEYEGLSRPVFSPDGRRVAYEALRGGKFAVGAAKVGNTRQMVVIDGVEGPPYEGVGSPVFSPDSRHIAYWAHTASGEKRSHVVLDDSEGEKYDRVADPVFSPDSQRVAYVAWHGKQTFLVNGAQVTAAEAADDTSDVVFSPDGRRVAYIAKRGKRLFVIVDGVAGAAYDKIGLPVFSLDGRLGYAARQGKKAFMVIEGAGPREQTPYVQLGDPLFSPDGRRVAYLAFDGKKELVVDNGIAGKPYDEVGRLVFSPDGQHLAFEARQGSKWHLVVGEVEGPEYTPIEEGSRIEREWRQVLRRGWVFEKTDKLWYVGPRQDAIVRLEVQFRQAPATPR
jgi:WD40 repeat protein